MGVRPLPFPPSLLHRVTSQPRLRVGGTPSPRSFFLPVSSLARGARCRRSAGRRACIAAAASSETDDGGLPVRPPAGAFCVRILAYDDDDDARAFPTHSGGHASAVRPTPLSSSPSSSLVQAAPPSRSHSFPRKILMRRPRRRRRQWRMKRQRRVRSSESRRRGSGCGSRCARRRRRRRRWRRGRRGRRRGGRGTSNAGIEEGEMRQFTNPLCDGKMT